MNEAFGLGLQITGIGMGLVFLTLILIMLAIMLLDRAFRPKVAEKAGPTAAAAAVAAAPVTAAGPVPASSDMSDEVAAMAVAIVNARTTATRVASPVDVAQEDMDTYDEIVGEVITVIRAEPGPSNFAREGRLGALE